MVHELPLRQVMDAIQLNPSNRLPVAECRHIWSKFGSFYRHCDSSRIQRFRCKLCGLNSSVARNELFYRQRLRAINSLIFKQLVSGVSQRRCAIILHLNRKTVVRKFRVMGGYSVALLKLQNQNSDPVKEMEFDDLETFEHTKCKPLSVTLAVEKKTRRILGFEVSRMPAKGRLAAISIKKYGPRKDGRAKSRKKLFREIKSLVHPLAEIMSDDNPHYPPDIRTHFPLCSHITIKGGRGAITGQGELKRLKFDPIFSINHTFAKLRGDINRLFRKTWCTTKDPSQLRIHIAMMAIFHNHRLADPKVTVPIFNIGGHLNHRYHF